MGWSDAAAGPGVPGRSTLGGIPRSEPPIVQKDEALASTVRQPADSSSPREGLASNPSTGPPAPGSSMARKRLVAVLNTGQMQFFFRELLHAQNFVFVDGGRNRLQFQRQAPVAE